MHNSLEILPSFLSFSKQGRTKDSLPVNVFVVQQTSSLKHHLIFEIFLSIISPDLLGSCLTIIYKTVYPKPCTESMADETIKQKLKWIAISLHKYFGEPKIKEFPSREL